MKWVGQRADTLHMERLSQEKWRLWSGYSLLEPDVYTEVGDEEGTHVWLIKITGLGKVIRDLWARGSTELLEEGWAGHRCSRPFPTSPTLSQPVLSCFTHRTSLWDYIWKKGFWFPALPLLAPRCWAHPFTSLSLNVPIVIILAILSQGGHK